MIARMKVARGARYLDRVKPDWYGLVDVETLNLISAEDCVLGQVFGDYETGLSHLFGGNGPDLTDRIEYGFTNTAVFEDLPELNEVWALVVDARKMPVTVEELELVNA